MKIIYLGLLLSLIIQTEDYEGLWKTNKDHTIIEIYKENNIYYGKIVSSNNSKAKKGTLILRDFKYLNGKYIGKLYAIKIDKLVDAEMKINNGILEITAQLGFMNKTIEWKKISK